MYSSVNIVIDEQSTKLSEQLEMIHYLKNKVGVVDFTTPRAFVKSTTPTLFSK